MMSENNHVTMYVDNKNPEDGASIVVTKHNPTEQEKNGYRMRRRLLFDGLTLHVLVAGNPLSDEAIAVLARSYVEGGAVVLHIDLRALGMDPWSFASYRNRNGKRSK